VVLSKGSNYAIQIDGLITLASDGDFKGNAFIIKGATDVEVFSSNGLHHSSSFNRSECPSDALHKLQKSFRP